MSKSASIRQLQLSKYKLSILLEITNMIKENTPISQLIKKFKDVLIQDLNIGKISIYRFNGNFWRSLLDEGVPKRHLNNFDFNKLSVIKNDIIHIDEKFKELDVFDFIIPVYHKNTALAYVFIGDFEGNIKGISPSIKHINFIQTLANIVFVALENKRLFKELIKRESVKKEMQLAEKMQKMLIPDINNMLDNEHFTISAFYKPHFSVSGDFFDYIELNKNEIAFCIADVSGKGISAAILMANFQANLRALISNNISLKELVIKLNDRIVEITNNDRFVTFFIAKYNTKEKILNYINCGHIPPILHNKKTKKITSLRKGTIGVGMLKHIPKIDEGTIHLTEKYRLLAVTDGVTETENNKLEEFGTFELSKIIQQNSNIKQVITDVYDKLVEYNNYSETFADDITILGVDFH